MTVGILTTSEGGDVAVERVADLLRARGQVVDLIEVDRFPADGTLTHALDGGPPDRLRLGDIDLTDLRSLWVRFGEPGAGLAPELGEAHRAIAGARRRPRSTARRVSRHLRRRSTRRRARRAARVSASCNSRRVCGFGIPRTLITNDAAALQHFRAVSTVTSSCGLSIRARSDRRPSSRLSRHGCWIRPSSMRSAALQVSPMQFQERIAKALELRITVVGDRVFAAAVDSARRRPAGWTGGRTRR